MPLSKPAPVAASNDDFGDFLSAPTASAKPAPAFAAPQPAFAAQQQLFAAPAPAAPKPQVNLLDDFDALSLFGVRATKQRH